MSTKKEQNEALNKENSRFNLLATLNLIIDLFLLSLMWVVGCIPLITIGTSTTALYYTANKVIHQERSYLWREFRKSYVSNFKQITPIWLLAMVIGGIIFADTRIALANYQTSQLYKVIYWALRCLLGFLIVWANYLFAYQARIEDKLKVKLKNTLIMLVVDLPKTIVMLFIILCAVYISGEWPFTTYLVPAVIAWLYAAIFDGIFKRYIKEDEDEHNEMVREKELNQQIDSKDSIEFNTEIEDIKK